MKRFASILLFITSCNFAYASDDSFECSKHDGDVVCKAKKNNVSVEAITINGGECQSPADANVYHKNFNKGEKFTVPGSHECFYVRTVSVKAHGGDAHHHHAL